MHVNNKTYRHYMFKKKLTNALNVDNKFYRYFKY